MASQPQRDRNRDRPVKKWPPSKHDADLQPDEIGPQPGWYAISVNFLYGGIRQSWWGRPSHEYTEDPSWSYFKHFKRSEQIGYSMYIYHITLDDANRVRRKLGLPELATDGVSQRKNRQGSSHRGADEKSLLEELLCHRRGERAQLTGCAQ